MRIKATIENHPKVGQIVIYDDNYMSTELYLYKTSEDQHSYKRFNFSSLEEAKDFAQLKYKINNSNWSEIADSELDVLNDWLGLTKSELDEDGKKVVKVLDNGEWQNFKENDKLETSSNFTIRLLLILIGIKILVFFGAISQSTFYSEKILSVILTPSFPVALLFEPVPAPLFYLMWILFLIPFWSKLEDYKIALRKVSLFFLYFFEIISIFLLFVIFPQMGY